MSALPPKADMCSATRDVRFVPDGDIPTLRIGVQKQADDEDAAHQACVHSSALAPARARTRASSAASSRAGPE